jgi:hypothetical protein
MLLKNTLVCLMIRQNSRKSTWGQIFILDIARWIRTSMRFLLKQTERKVKDKDLTPIFTPVGIVSTLVVMFGCAPMTAVVKVNVAYVPSEGPAKPQITTSKRIRIEPILDRRWNIALGEIKDEYGKIIGMYMSNTDVPKVITEAIKVELTNQGYPVISEGGDVVLSGDLLGLKGKRIQGFFLRGTFEAAAQARMALKDASGNVIWSGVVNGRSELKYGPLTKPNERFVEAIDSAITDLIERLIGSESFRSALM